MQFNCKKVTGHKKFSFNGILLHKCLTISEQQKLLKLVNFLSCNISSC